MKLTFYQKASTLYQPQEDTIQQKCSKIYFYLTEESDSNTTSQIQQTKPKDHNNQLAARYYNPAQAGPPSGQDPFLDTYRKSIIKAYLKELENPTASRKKEPTTKTTPGHEGPSQQ